MEFRILGPLEVMGDIGEPVPLGGPKQRAVLALLVLDVGQVVSTDGLVDGVWGQDPPENAGRTLQVYVSNLRKVLDAETIETRAPGYRLVVDEGDVDLLRFRRLVTRAEDAVPSQRAQTLNEALDLWRGSALSDLADLPLAQATAAGLEEERLAALEARINAELELGRHEQLVAELESLTTAHPLRERLRGQLMLALYRAGRQADALAVYDDTRVTLSEELGLDPSEQLQALQQRILEQDAALRVPSPSEEGPRRPQHNLPAALTSFVGRDEEIRAIIGLLVDHRLVTLTGVGGVGKTRLALEIARASIEHHTHGVWRVELAPLTDPDAITKTVATALSVPERPDQPLRDTLVAFLRDRDLLLVLDNCEHLLDPAARLVTDLLTGCPELRVLATSREGLGVPGEMLRPLRSLTVPDPDADPDEMGTVASVRLFIDRASEVDPAFALSPGNADAVAGICRQLDGIPLAIELAAARTAALSPHQIADRLGDRFQLLTGGSRTALPRHQTLKAAVDWSYDLLSERERAVLRRLSVFRGGFTLEAAEDVAAGDDVDRTQVLDALSHLVEQSLVTVERGRADARYDLLETIRQYALQRLRADDDTEAVRRRHLGHVVALAEHAEPRFQSPEERRWFDRFDTEYGNVRAAVEFALGVGDAVSAIRVLGALQRFINVREHRGDCLRWIDRALDLDDRSLTPRLEAAGLRTRGAMMLGADAREARDDLTRARHLAEQEGASDLVAQATFDLAGAERVLGNMDEATRLTEQALELAPDDWLRTGALVNLGILARYRGELDRSIELFEEVLDLLGGIGSPWAIAFTRASLGISLYLKGELEEAQEIFEELLADGRVNNRAGAVELLNMLGEIALARGEPAIARRRFLESVEMNQELGQTLTRTLAGSAAGLTAALHRLGDHKEAALVEGFRAELKDRFGVALPPPTRRLLDEALPGIRAALGDDGFEAAMAAGRQLELTELLAELTSSGGR
ncbi:MAG: BTAD domain-containing putative transcriptional regulator [Nitriliruptorales bacterium]|nr:BTAD domain-containing putative transcriptional regulator [Nitriliruptorales bacterium]